MNIWFVTPAWRRFPITRLALAQRRQLCDELASCGITANCVVIADDENLNIAREYGFPVVEMDNSQLGRKFNAGIQYAASHGADFISAIGSDNWVHPDFFMPMVDGRYQPERSMDYVPDLSAQSSAVWHPGPVVLSGRTSFMVDLEVGVGQRIRSRNRVGIIPWIIPRSALPSDFSPIEPELPRGIDGSLARGLVKRPAWEYHDPHDLCRVGWKSDVNITLFEGLAFNLGYGPEEADPWSLLATRYPRYLVDMALATHNELAKEMR